MSANSKQVSGDHYKKLPIEPWDYVAKNGLDYFQGSVIKYISRWRDKGGIDDLKKARHFLDKYIEVEQARAGASPLLMDLNWDKLIGGIEDDIKQTGHREPVHDYGIEGDCYAT